MSSQTIETITTTSWGQRLRQSTGALVLGAALAVAMLVLLWTNEGRAVRRAQVLHEGEAAVQPAQAARVQAQLQGKLVHVSGPLRTPAPLQDPLLGVQAPGVRLERSVEMYQWVQSQSTEKDVALGGSETQRTTYTYSTAWRAQHQDAQQFHQSAGHHNPPMRLQSASVTAPRAALGVWQLGAPVLQTLGHWQPLALQGVARPAIERAVHSALGAPLPVHVLPDALYVGANPAQPQVGDYRIRFRYVPLDVVSVVARQNGQALTPHTTRSGRTFLLTAPGEVPASAMFAQAQASNSTLTWVLRAVGVGGLVLAMGWVLRPLAVFASVLPWLGTVVGWGTGAVAAVLGGLLAALTISLAWLAYRPLWALGLLGVSAALAAAWLWQQRRRAPADAASVGAAQPSSAAP